MIVQPRQLSRNPRRHEQLLKTRTQRKTSAGITDACAHAALRTVGAVSREPGGLEVDVHLKGVGLVHFVHLPPRIHPHAEHVALAVHRHVQRLARSEPPHVLLRARPPWSGSPPPTSRTTNDLKTQRGTRPQACARRLLYVHRRSSCPYTTSGLRLNTAANKQ